MNFRWIDETKETLVKDEPTRTRLRVGDVLELASSINLTGKSYNGHIYAKKAITVRLVESDKKSAVIEVVSYME